MKAPPQKVLLITGISSGVGEALALMAINQGYFVAGIDIKRNEKFEKLIREKKMFFIKQDLAKIYLIQRTIEKIIERTYGIDAVVNCAGVSYGGKDLNFAYKDWRISLNVNLIAPAFISKFVALDMIRKKIKGSIVNISSLSGLKGVGKPQYAASKLGILALTKSLSKSLGQYGIRVNAIIPGAINTPMISDWMPEQKKRIAKESPLNRIAEPKEIASIILFLISPEASYLTGSFIDATGGRL